MPAATVAEVREALTNLVKLVNFKSSFKNLDNLQTFDNVCFEVNKALENKEIDKASTMMIAQVIKEHFKEVFSYGAKDKVGPYNLKDLQSLVAKVAPTATFTNLKTIYTVGSDDYKKARAEVANLLNVDDKTHSSHGSNFKGNQSLEQIIVNVCAPVKGTAKIAEMKQLALRYYNYRF